MSDRAKIIKKIELMERIAETDAGETDFLKAKLIGLEERVQKLREEIRKLKANN